MIITITLKLLKKDTKEKRDLLQNFLSFSLVLYLSSTTLKRMFLHIKRTTFTHFLVRLDNMAPTSAFFVKVHPSSFSVILDSISTSYSMTVNKFFFTLIPFKFLVFFSYPIIILD